MYIEWLSMIISIRYVETNNWQLNNSFDTLSIKHKPKRISDHLGLQQLGYDILILNQQIL